MEKRVECEIVQDLLLGYVDETLNIESKKIVEKHLSECSSCKKKLEEIKADIKENELNQQKEIDYLKKIRRKTKLKSIAIALAIIFFTILVLIIIKFVKISSVMNRGVKSLQAQNYYSEKQQIVKEGETFVTKTYYKDGKYKEVNEIYTDEGVNTISIIYGKIGTDETIKVNEKDKTITVNKGEIAKWQNKEENIKWSNFSIDERKSVILNLGKTFIMSLDTDNYGTNKQYYVLKNNFDKNKRWEVWIDKETGLVIKEINREASKSFFENTDIVKEVNDIVEEYKYEFNIVKEEDIEIPDYSGYKIENANEKLLDIN